MLSGLKLFFGKHIRLITIFVFVGMVATIGILGYMYKNQLERNAQLEYSLAIQTDALKKANQKIESERQAASSARESLRAVSRRYARLEALLNEESRDEDGNLTDGAVIRILCEARVAEPRLCP